MKLIILEVRCVLMDASKEYVNLSKKIIADIIITYFL